MTGETNFSNILTAHSDLTKRFEFSKGLLKSVQSKTTLLLGNQWQHVAVFAAGSLGRFETGRLSDLDIFLVGGSSDINGSAQQISHLQEIQLLSHLIRMNEELKLPEFSGDGRYLKVHALDRVITSTGDANDDSENFFTTRLLLLLEQ